MLPDPNAPLRDRVLQRVVEGEAESSAALRKAAFEGAGLSPDLKPLIEKVHAHACKVTDEDVAKVQHAYGDATPRSVIADYMTAPISEQLRAMLRLLERCTLEPDRLTPDDVRVVLDTGVTREAIRDAFYVAFLFNTYDILADTLGWELPDRRYYPKAGKFLLKKGYL